MKYFFIFFVLILPPVYCYIIDRSYNNDHHRIGAIKRRHGVSHDVQSLSHKRLPRRHPLHDKSNSNELTQKSWTSESEPVNEYGALKLKFRPKHSRNIAGFHSKKLISRKLIGGPVHIDDGYCIDRYDLVLQPRKVHGKLPDGIEKVQVMCGGPEEGCTDLQRPYGTNKFFTCVNKVEWVHCYIGKTKRDDACASLPLTELCDCRYH